MANVCDCVTRHASLQTDMFAFLVFETRKYTYQVFIGVWTPTNQPRFWSQWPVLDILETHLPWRQRVIQLATVQGHEEEALALRGGNHEGDLELCEVPRCAKVQEQSLKMCFLFWWGSGLKKMKSI